MAGQGRRLRALTVALVAALGACATTTAGSVRHVPLPDGDRAADLVWQHYGVRTRARPVVKWVGPESLNCAEGRGWIDTWGRCVAGLFHNETWTAEVAAPAGVHLADTGLAHELCHGLTEWYGVDDSDHRICYQGGSPVKEAQELLRASFP